MRYGSVEEFLGKGQLAGSRGPVALIMAEDEVELDSTLRHHLAGGFSRILLFAPPDLSPGLEAAPDFSGRIDRIDDDVFAEDALVTAVNRVMDAAAGAWLFWCYNAEYLFFPFCESRTISDLVGFHAEERREAMLTYVIDLYACDLDRFPNAVSLEDAHLDRSGYYALTRKEAEPPWTEKERQMDFFGGLRWRFEEHVPWTRRKIDRISILRAKRGLRLRPDFTLSEEEMNTFACPWHHNVTATVCSFRTAKALRTNPGSRDEIRTFRWHNSEPFRWESQQLMDLGLMEPGQWF
ncbi:glycosyltransferase family 2 protein [Pseudogemmobacter humi]|uniref:Glycosyl transferase family 2 n=1 Tax=Pseudogemmobacter humi TaxID=2483812 RepID=A0A3P5XV20_9RHOB|nr:glycosyltransferase family 2 protein [Pseudogemmobacter humi]VDC33027.1 hypothetical protein XINFAN_03573 [Pseudogemmobacter humi]